MPYKTNKKQTRKRKVSINAIQKKMMTSRLMAINLKVDDYVYKKKPISIQEADTYAREMETFRHLCCDERYLQVIEKLSSYMKFLIKEQSSKNTVDVNLIDQIQPIEELHNGNENVQDNAGLECNAFDIEIERSFSDLSIVGPKDPLAILDINENDHKKAKIENSTSTLTKEYLNEVKNLEVAYINTKNNDTESKKANVNTINQKQKEIVEVASIKSQNLLSSFEYDNYISVRNDKNTKNKLTEHIFKDTSNKITIYCDMNTGNKNNKSELSNHNAIKQNKQIIDDSSKLSQNLLSNFNYGKFAVLSEVKNNSNPNNNKLHYVNDIPNNIRNKGTKLNNMNTENNNANLEEVSHLNNIKQNEICSASNILTHDILSYGQNRSYAVVGVVQNNANLQKKQFYLVDDTSNDIANNTNNGNNYHDSNSVIRKEIGEDSNKLSQNLLRNFEYGNYAASVLQNNTNTTKDSTQQSIEKKYTNIIDNTQSGNSQQIILTPNIDGQIIIPNNPLENQTNGVKRVTKQRKTVKKDTTKKGTYNRKKKVSNITTAQDDLNKKGTVNPAVQGTTEPKNSVNNSIQKNKRVFLKKKREVIDLSWVEKVKFVRVIESEEYTKFYNFEESFWSDLTLPQNINVTDFEDNINIWKS